MATSTPWLIAPVLFAWTPTETAVITSPDQEPVLAPHYYRDNFLRLLDTVVSQYQDMLSTAERRFVDCYRGLQFDSQCLYVRLVSRVGPWFREGKLHYPELGPLSVAVDELLQSGMAVEAQLLRAAELGRLYSRQELLRAFARPAATSKSSLLESLDPQETHDLQLFPQERIIGPAGLDTVTTLQLLFFGNRHQGLTDFVLSDLGVARHFPYPLDRSQRLFPRREALDEYLECAAIADLWYEAREQENALQLLPGIAEQARLFRPVYPTTLHRWHRLCNSLGRELERQGGAELAAALYEQSQLQPARERRARLLEKNGHWQQALDLCEQILAAPWGEEERDAALRIQPRLLRHLQGRKLQRRRDQFDEISLAVTRKEEPVELAAARELGARWGNVFYVENTLMNGLFGLAFWEQIFAPLPGAFNNPFQSAPSDMYDQDFTLRRGGMIEERLSQLESASMAEELVGAWQRYHGYRCRWVNWRYLDEALVRAAGEIIPSAHLVAVWRRMLFDPGENRRGFPDLLALGHGHGDYCMIEVKGPGDALQESQKRWLRFFAQQGIPAQVAWVSWRDA
jgi:VRR-NUC domain-containing protein/Fanconi-associated nuclease 1-like protein